MTAVRAAGHGTTVTIQFLLPARLQHASLLGVFFLACLI
jgi:hypothetical protein